MSHRSKRYSANRQLVPTEPVELDAALAVLKKFKTAKFDETVEVCLELGIDPKKSDQMVRGAVSLPRGIGRTLRVIVFCAAEKVAAAKAAGAVEAGAEDLVDRIQKQNWLEFDVAVATPDMMKIVGKLGKVLGPHGKMPSPKSGTVTADVESAVREFRAGKIEFRADAGGNVHAPVGKASFDAAALKENIDTFIEHVRQLKPVSSKGKYIKQVHISTTMGAGIPVAVS